MNRIIKILWIAFFLSLANLVFVIKTFGQDSVVLKVKSSYKIKDTTFYIFKIVSTGEKVFSKCVCKEFRKRGEKVKVARRDLKFIKQDL